MYYIQDYDDGEPALLTAAELKKISEDSREVFPPSEYGSVSAKERRWKSVYDTDFKPEDLSGKTQLPTMIPPDASRNNPQPSQMFMQWKVPSRLTDAGQPDGDAGQENLDNNLAKGLNEVRLQSPKEYRTPRSLDVTHTTHHAPPLPVSERKPTPYLPQIGNQSPRLGSRASGSRLSVLQSAHSRLESRVSEHSGLGGRAGTSLSLKSNRSKKPLSSPVRRSADFVDNTIKPDVNSKAYELLQRATPNERRQIEKALRSADRSKLEKSLAKTLQPDAKESVMQWLETASEQDRKVAVKFFQSLSGNKLMGEDSEEQNTRINQVISTLKKNKANGIGLPNGYIRDDRARQLQHLRLLTPNTRDKRWMHTTWHHLPPYHDTDPVNNRSAIYMEMKPFPPRHFTIHPEWGP